MYDQSTLWQAPPGAQSSGAAAPDSAELPTPFGMFGSSPSHDGGAAQPDPWADNLSSNQSKTWGHSDWQWQGNSWNRWRSWNEAKTLGTDPRGGNAWGRNWSWDATWAELRTRISQSRQGLVLYQHLTGKVWIEAERLDLDKLSGSSEPAYFVDWIRERYLDVQVTQVGRSLSEFFRKLRKRPGQSIRDYVGEFDRAKARLEECGCSLPNIALDRM